MSETISALPGFHYSGLMNVAEAGPRGMITLRGDLALLRRSFETLYTYVTRAAPGFGLERCLYEFNRSWPCLSPLVRDDYVVEPADLLPALETAAARHGIGLLAGTFIDRSDYARLVQIVQGAAVVLAVALTAVTAGGLMTII